MKKIVLFSLFLGNVLLITSCCEKEELKNQTSTENLIKQVQFVREVLNKAMIENDFRTQLNYFTEDITRLNPNKPILKGKSSWEKDMERFTENGVNIKSANNKIIEIWKSENYIYEIGIAKIEIELPGAVNAKDDEAKYLCIWECFPDGSIKIKYSMWNTNKPFEGL